MFGIGFSEIILICLVMIILIRPNDLPKALRTVGRYYGKAKKIYNELIMVKDRILKEIDEAVTLEEPKDTQKLLSSATNPETSTVPAAEKTVSPVAETDLE